MTAGPAEAPSGRQYEISHGEHRAVVVEVGGGLRSYRHRGFDVLDGYAAGEICDGARGQPLIPWPNRIRDGRYAFAGVEHQLALSEPERGNAIHGLLRWTAWRATEHGADRVTLEAILDPRPGYPFRLAAALGYRLGAEGLQVSMTARNAGSQALPFGAGQHPYLRVSDGLVDDATVRVPARTWLPADARGIPTGERKAVDGPYDLREPRRLDRLRLDTAFTDLDREADGRARVVMSGPDRSLTLWMDERFRHLMLYTGDTLAPGRRRRGLAVEPMTCPPNAFQSGDDLVVLEPGEAFTGVWGVSPGSPSATD